MSQFKFKNLPRGFEFPFTKVEIREFIKTTPANFELVEFDGLSSAERYYSRKFESSWIWVCYLKAEYRDSEWVFKLEVNGAHTERYNGRREEIAGALLTAITNWANAKLALPEMAPKKPCRANVYFDLTRESEDIVQLSEWD